MDSIQVLDHGYVRLIECWGHGDAGFDTEGIYTELPKIDYEVGMIEAARQSTQGSFRGWEQDEKLLKFLHNNKHSTPFEFSGMIIEVRAPIFVFREWHRHRTQSYNEMSARYAPLPDMNYVPTKERCFINSTKNKQAGTIKGAEELYDETHAQWESDLKLLYDQIQSHYEYGLSVGIPKELARIILPVGRYSQMRASTCLRNWLTFLTLRMDPNAQYEIRMFANAVGQIIAKQFPRTWALFNSLRSGE